MDLNLWRVEGGAKIIQIHLWTYIRNDSHPSFDPKTCSLTACFNWAFKSGRQSNQTMIWVDLTRSSNHVKSNRLKLVSLTWQVMGISPNNRPGIWGFWGNWRKFEDTDEIRKKNWRFRCHVILKKFWTIFGDLIWLSNQIKIWIDLTSQNLWFEHSLIQMVHKWSKPEKLFVI